jgi:adenosylcobalamin-dependent ribonucleoside-triphosphate reductase
MSFKSFTPRAAAVALRTYCRPKKTGGLERWPQVITRSTIDHHERLWTEAGGTPDVAELTELAQLGVERKSVVSGRTLWLGGTDYAYSRPCCQFNCSALVVSSVYDFVDAAWLLLNGSGVGFRPKSGTLHGYPRHVKLQVVDSHRPPEYRGPDENRETLPTADNNYTWTIKVGDSAAAWAKALGKLFNGGSRSAKVLVFDGSDCRGPGGRLSGYGWICNGFAPLAKAVEGIHATLNEKSGQLLDEIDIMDCVNRVGEILSSRRSAQMTVLDSSHPLEHQFARAKEDYWKNGLGHRRQSNNSELFWSKPTLSRLVQILYHADECGGDPGIINADGARRKAPWFELVNPCAEILLPSMGFCNLVTNCLPRFGRPGAALYRALWLIARANYRQTCVDMRDGVLQPGWHQANEALRLCGVSLTGIVKADKYITDYTIRQMKNAAIAGMYSMADELGLPRSKAGTTLKPEGTASKTMGGTDVGEIPEGMNRPLGRYIFNWVNFGVDDPIAEHARAAGYRVIPNPQDGNNVLVCWPVEYEGVDFDSVNGTPVNLEPAVSQLDRYLRWNTLWADHNVSATISYSPEELPAVAEWVHRNWDSGYVATAFQRRIDPTMTPEDVNQPYLPQEVVGRGKFDDYRKGLAPIDWDAVADDGVHDMPVATNDPGCKGGECAVR